MNAKTGVVTLALLFLVHSPAGRAQKDQDRFGLAKQPQIYLVHQTARYNFMIEGGAARVIGGPLAIVQQHESAQLQQKLDLRDPVNYLKDRLAETLRRELGLTNLQIEPDASDLPILAESLGDEARAAKPATFKDKHPTGAVIEVVTRHWGIDNYKMKYTASVWMTDLDKSKRVMSGSCPWVIFEQVDEKKMPARSAFDQQGRYDPSAGEANAAAMEQAIYGNNGEMLKANLRKAAEQCADRLAGRFVAGFKAP